MVSDLGKDPDLKPNMPFVNGMASALPDDRNLDQKAVIDWIEGFTE